MDREALFNRLYDEEHLTDKEAREIMEQNEIEEYYANEQEW